MPVFHVLIKDVLLKASQFPAKPAKRDSICLNADLRSPHIEHVKVCRSALFFGVEKRTAHLEATWKGTQGRCRNGDL